jgi:hypothetical protein
MNTYNTQLTNTLEERARERAWLFLTPEVTAGARLTLVHLQQFAAGAFHPDEAQLRSLARLMGLA